MIAIVTRLRISRPLIRALASLALLTGALVGSTRAYAVVVRTAVAYRPVPVARPVARTAAVVGTAAIVGSVVSTLPPSCTAVAVGNVSYQQCGSTWYQPMYAGSAVSYTVVNPPR